MAIKVGDTVRFGGRIIKIETEKQREFLSYEGYVRVPTVEEVAEIMRNWVEGHEDTLECARKIHALYGFEEK